jgi:hypothetical protein
MLEQRKILMHHPRFDINLCGTSDQVNYYRPKKRTIAAAGESAEVQSTSATDVQEYPEEYAVSIHDKNAVAKDSFGSSSVSNFPRPIGVKRAKLEERTLSTSDALRRTLESAFLEQRRAAESVKSAFSEQISELTDIFLYSSLPEGPEKTDLMHSLLNARSKRHRLLSDENGREKTSI